MEDHKPVSLSSDLIPLCFFFSRCMKELIETLRLRRKDECMWHIMDVVAMQTNTAVKQASYCTVWPVWSREKSLASAGNRTLAVRLVAPHYTDRAIPAP
jgi:hypothetical protein